MHSIKNQGIITIDHVVRSYRLLQSEDPSQQHQANLFLCSLSHRDQAWEIAQSMLNNLQDSKFQFLGTQILYQKVSSEILNLKTNQKMELHKFVFSKLSDPNIKEAAIIDKLASIVALIGCISCIDGGEWANLIPDLLGFMVQNQHNLKSGLFVLQRIPQQLRLTNRINIGKKNAIIDYLLLKQKQMSEIFDKILDMKNNDLLIKKCLQAMESWAKSRFNFIAYPQLIKKVLLHSLQSFIKFEPAIVMMLQTIKAASCNKSSTMSSISEWQPSNELSKYNQQEVQSLKLIIQYISENEQNFTSKTIETEFLEMYLEIIKQSLLNFSFLIMEDIGFKLLDLIIIFTKSSDLRLSQSMFQFWIDFSQKMLKCQVDQKIKDKFGSYIDNLFSIITKNIMVQNQLLLEDPDMKQDVTIDDDINAMSFAEYRKQSVVLLQHIYSYFLDYTGSPKYYFDKCFSFIGAEANGKLEKGTQLALFCIKSAIESMISQLDADYICKFLQFVIKKGTNVYPRIAVESLMLIRDCTRQIKKNSQLCAQALNYSLFYLKDERICFYAAQAFKILMETVTTIGDGSIVQNMLTYYQAQTFPNEQIVDKIIQGIFLTITKLSNDEAIVFYLTKLVEIVVKKFEFAHENIKQNANKPYFLPILQIKTIMDNFEGSSTQFKLKFANLQQQIVKVALKMISIVIPYSLNEKQKYFKFNELGYSCSIYKLALKMNNQEISKQLLDILDLTLTVLKAEQILVMHPILQILCFTLINFTLTKQTNQVLDGWLSERIKYINSFYMGYMSTDIHLVDVDIIKSFYQIQQAVLLYNSQIFLKTGLHFNIFDLALYALRHFNQAKMQRKVINFLYICCQMKQVFYDRFPKLIQTILKSIPIISNVSFSILGKMFVLVSAQLPNIRDILVNSLKSNPYQGISAKTVQILVNLIMLIVHPPTEIPLLARQRRFIMMVKDLDQLAKSGQVQNQIIQFEFRLANWKKNKEVDNADI